MSSFLIVSAGLIYFVLWGLLMAATFDPPRQWMRWPSAVAWFLATAIPLALIVNAKRAENASGPCFQWETRMMWTGKVMAPARVCVSRGEWVNPEDGK